MTTRLSSREKQLGEEELFSVLGHRFRIGILALLHENVELSYTELLEMLGIDEGLLNFHLRKMRKLVKITEAKTYMLSDLGKTAHALIKAAQDMMEDSEQLSALGGPISIALTPDLVLRRVFAFVVDGAVLLFSTGLFFDKNFLAFLLSALELRFAYLLLPELSYQTIAAYSHIFFAAYIIFTVLESYKGQTLGKFLFKIRVVKVRAAPDTRGRISLMDSAVRNIGKVFLLPLDLVLGVVLYSRRGYLRFFDFYTRSTVERVMPI